MTDRPSPSISTRKEPRQSRSTHLVQAALEAALQVLVEGGAARFTMARVAERAGVSVGSLYQYFPNKAALLFRLQSDEWRETSGMLRAILAERDRPPAERLRRLLHAFLRSECEEAAVRIALDDAAPLYRDAPEARAAKAGNDEAFADFLREAAPAADEAARALALDLLKTTMTGACSRFSETPHSDAEIAAYGDALGDMLCAYLGTLGAR